VSTPGLKVIFSAPPSSSFTLETFLALEPERMLREPANRLANHRILAPVDSRPDRPCRRRMVRDSLQLASRLAASLIVIPVLPALAVTRIYPRAT